MRALESWAGSLEENLAGKHRPRRPWLVLTLGFGGLLVFLVAAATGTLIVLNRVRHTETTMRQAFLGRLSALDQIRAGIYLSGTYVRDFLLSPDPSGAQAEIARLASLERETRSALDAYGHSLDPDERAPFLNLRSEIDAYWRVLDRTVAWTPEERHRLRYSFFYDELVPRRTSMLQIADRIAAVNERGLNRAEEDLAASSDGLRRSLMLTFAIALAGGLVLALVTIGFTLRLERELERRLEENARARGDLRELSASLLRAQENERRNLARELHDEVGQSLSAILMEAENAACAGEFAEARGHLDSIRSLAGKTVNQVRDLALLLRPSMLDDLGLVPALQWQAREASKRSGIWVKVAAGEVSEELPEDHKTCVYRIVQEALHNIVQHANARNVTITVAQEPDRLLLSIQDDGRGFNPPQERGMGLIGMEERVSALGGRLMVESASGEGTLLRVALPLPQAVTANAG